MTGIQWIMTLLHLFNGATRPLSGVVPPTGLTVSARSCEPCHAKVVEEWQQSAHANAFDNSLFRASFKHEPAAWCVNCHAPLPEQATGALRNEGVGCATCHIRDGVILATRPATAEAQKAHPILVDARLAQPEFCASCHQFNWPITMEPVRYGPHAMQNTFAEFSQHRGSQTCVSCHMASGHRMPGGHDPEWVRGALDIAIAIAPRVKNRVHIRLSSRSVGHAVPTGDPFRRLVLELCTSPTCAPALRSFAFGRRFDATQNGKLIADKTIPLRGARAFEVTTSERATYWRLVYRYSAIGTDRDLDDDDREQEITHGTIAGGN